MLARKKLRKFTTEMKCIIIYKQHYTMCICNTEEGYRRWRKDAGVERTRGVEEIENGRLSGCKLMLKRYITAT